MTKNSGLEIRNLTVVYNPKTSTEVVALEGFALKAKPGEIVVITGDNGTGKSTLLKAISGAIPVTTGQIFVNDQEITKWSFLRRTKIMNSVNQDVILGTCPNLTLNENFQLTNSKKWWLPIPYKLSLSKSQVLNIQKTGLQLEDKELSKLSMLSGGQRQAIALCLAKENYKPILLLDEFTSSLDTTTCNKVLKYTFEEAIKNDTIVVMVLHDISKIENLNYYFTIINIS
jgi:putative ABC transport system ATP-binding protein